MSLLLLRCSPYALGYSKANCSITVNGDMYNAGMQYINIGQDRSELKRDIVSNAGMIDRLTAVISHVANPNQLSVHVGAIGIPPFPCEG